MKNRICITGMHRSGTSLTSSWLKRCGLKIDDGSLIGKNVGNEKGHFEDKDFVDIHAMELLLRNKRSKGWIYYTTEFLEFSKILLPSIKNIINGRDEKFDIWGWKDPRTVLFLDEWKKMIPNLKVVLIWRKPEDVVSSLLRRSHKSNNYDLKIKLYEAIRLWYIYNNLVVKYKSKYPDDTLLFYLEKIVNEDGAVINLINERFNIELKYFPLDNLFDSSFIHSKNISNMLLKPVNYIEKIINLKSVLKKYSD